MLRTRTITAGILLTSFTAFSAVAAPTISGVSGGTTHGSAVTITGSGFGTKSRPAPLLWDTVDNQYSLESIVSNQLVSTDVFLKNSSDYAVRFAELSPVSRTPLSKAQYHGAGNSWLGHPVAAGGYEAPTSQTQLYVAWWIRFAVDPYENANSASHKFTRIWAGGDNDLRVSWTQRQLTVQNSNAGGTSALSTWAGDVWGTAARWHLHEMWVDTKTGTAQAWVNGKLVHDFHSSDPRYLMRSHPAGLNLTLIGWNPSHGETGATNSFDMDDIVVDNTRARVVISDASTWSQTQVREYQPATTWTANQISISLNLGQIPTSKPKYLYVVAPDGSVNTTGFALAGGVQPNPPTSLSAQ